MMNEVPCIKEICACLQMLAPCSSNPVLGFHQASPQRSTGPQANSLHCKDAQGFVFAPPIARQHLRAQG